MEGRQLLLGKVVTVTRSGYIVARINDPNMRIKIGNKVTDSKGVEIGKIIDIIGNVEKPYAVIKPSENARVEHEETLYLLIPRRRRGVRRKGGRVVGRERVERERVPSGRHRSHTRRAKGMHKRRKGSKQR